MISEFCCPLMGSQSPSEPLLIVFSRLRSRWCFSLQCRHLNVDLELILAEGGSWAWCGATGVVFRRKWGDGCGMFDQGGMITGKLMGIGELVREEAQGECLACGARNEVSPYVWNECQFPDIHGHPETMHLRWTLVSLPRNYLLVSMAISEHPSIRATS